MNVVNQSNMLNIDSNRQEGPSDRVRTIAFYLPQFHPIPENDEWWGKGFTEWTNVTKAEPLFEGHYQPHLPTDFGFYDLRVRETRRDQIAVAKQHGIDGFCYHYYWFSGKRLLERPFEDMLSDAGSDMPFCINWANENWTRRWDASEQSVLIAQDYHPEDDLNFIKNLVPVLRDPRYITVDGAPLIIVYRPQHLPDARKTADIWRQYCQSIGIPKLNIRAALVHGNWDYSQFGFDGGVEFPPHNIWGPMEEGIEFYNPFSGVVVQFKDVATYYLEREYGPDDQVFRTVFPSWDNTARVNDRALVISNGTPGNYEYWLASAISKTRAEFPAGDRLVFVNAWNEWAEGCHLEPDRKYGRAFLEATLRAVNGQTSLTTFPDTGPAQIRVANEVEDVVEKVENVVCLPEPPLSVAASRFIRLAARKIFRRLPITKRILLWLYHKVRS